MTPEEAVEYERLTDSLILEMPIGPYVDLVPWRTPSISSEARVLAWFDVGYRYLHFHYEAIHDPSGVLIRGTLPPNYFRRDVPNFGDVLALPVAQYERIRWPDPIIYSEVIMQFVRSRAPVTPEFTDLRLETLYFPYCRGNGRIRELFDRTWQQSAVMAYTVMPRSDSDTHWKRVVKHWPSPRATRNPKVRDGKRASMRPLHIAARQLRSIGTAIETAKAIQTYVKHNPNPK